jgi:hypothetical protein
MGAFGQTVTTATNTGSVSTSLGWTGVRLSLCPLRTVRGSVAIAYCGLVNGGLLTAHADGLLNAKSDSRVSVGLGGSAYARWSLTQRLFLGGDLGVYAPLERARFYAAGSGSTPEIRLYELPSVGVFGGLFLGFDLFFPLRGSPSAS